MFSLPSVINPTPFLMKALFTFLIAVGLFTNTAHAQEQTQSKRFNFGVFAGLNYSAPVIRTQGIEHFDSKAALLTGVDLNYRLNRQSYLHIQPSWTQTNNTQRQGYGPSILFNISTVKIPVMFRYYVLPNRKLFFVETGVGFNQIVKGSYRREIVVYCISGPCLSELYEPDATLSNKLALSGIAGLGVNIPIQNISIPLTLRYERYANGHLLPGNEYHLTTPIKFENFALTTGVSF